MALPFHKEFFRNVLRKRCLGEKFLWKNWLEIKILSKKIKIPYRKFLWKRFLEKLFLK